jgi:hypothetical protein
MARRVHRCHQRSLVSIALSAAKVSRLLLKARPELMPGRKTLNAEVGSLVEHDHERTQLILGRHLRLRPHFRIEPLLGGTANSTVQEDLCG